MNNDERVRRELQEGDRKHAIEMVACQCTASAEVAVIEWQIRRNEALIRAKELERERIIAQLQANLNEICRVTHAHRKK